MAISLIRTMIVYFVLIIALRIMGKRQLGELAPSELVVAVLISDLASMPLQDTGVPLLYGLVPVMTLLSTEVLISYATLKSIRLRVFIGGKPSIIISEGKIDQKEMSKNRLTLDELSVEMRKQNVTDITTIRHAILESDGTLSIILYESASPVTPSQLKIKTKEPDLPVIVISDGHVMGNNLKKIGLDHAWLNKKLNEIGAESPENIYLLTANQSGKTYHAFKKE